MLPECPPKPGPKDKRNIPIMFIAPEVAARRIGNYLKNQHLICTGVVGKSDSVYFHFTRGQLHDLFTKIDAKTPIDNLSGLRIYFSDNKERYQELIFAPTQKDNNFEKDTSDYYILNMFGKDISHITRLDASAMVDAYQRFKLSTLATGINKNDTKSVWYEKSKIQELVCEITYLLAEGIDVEGINVYLAAYDTKEASDQTTDYSKQQCLIFTLMVNTQFGEIKIPLPYSFTDPNKYLIMGEDERDFDTGIPCPPSEICNGDGAGLP